MNDKPAGKTNLIVIVFLAALIIADLIFSKTVWVSFILGTGLLVILAATVWGNVKSKRISAVVSALNRNSGKRDLSSGPRLLGDILKESSSSRNYQKKIADMLSDKFQAGKFAIFFREGDNYVARVYSSMNPQRLQKPRAEKIRRLLRGSGGNEIMVRTNIVGKSLFNGSEYDDFESPITFIYSWARSKGIIFAAEDKEGLIADIVYDSEFNKAFWPALDSLVRQNEKKKTAESNLKKLRHEYSLSKNDLLKAGRELKKRITDLNSFVSISGDLYSILDEDQLFAELANIIKNQLKVGRVEILYPAGDGRFVADTGDGGQEGELAPPLNADSNIFNTLRSNPKPLLMPLLASGIESDNGFLKEAMKRGFQVISPIMVGNDIGCIILTGEKLDKGQFNDSEVGFLSVITNIASLSLGNIRQYKTIEKLSYTDSMTGIYNYRYFYKRLGEEILRAKRYNRELSLVILDIDNFKVFNDNFGHQTGDMVLRQISELITKTIRSIDIVSRYGGEEFCIIMPDTNEDNGRIFIDRLRNEIADFKFKSRSLQDEILLTVSVGCSVFPHHASAPDRLIYCADMALLKAKSIGKNKAIMYQPDFIADEISPIGRFEDE